MLIYTLVTNQDTTLLDGPLTAAPTLKGFLNKYTNVAKGYNSRWFVLTDGILSCAYNMPICDIHQILTASRLPSQRRRRSSYSRFNCDGIGYDSAAHSCGQASLRDPISTDRKQAPNSTTLVDQSEPPRRSFSLGSRYPA